MVNQETTWADVLQQLDDARLQTFLQQVSALLEESHAHHAAVEAVRGHFTNTASQVRVDDAVQSLRTLVHGVLLLDDLSLVQDAFVPGAVAFRYQSRVSESQFLVKMVAVGSAQLLVVAKCVAGPELDLDPTRVVKLQLRVPPWSDPAPEQPAAMWAQFHDVTSLVSQVRNRLTRRIVAPHGSGEGSVILRLPLDALLHTLTFLPARALLSLACTCAPLEAACSSQFLWRRLVLLDFGAVPRERVHWKNEYLSQLHSRQVQADERARERAWRRRLDERRRRFERSIMNPPWAPWFLRPQWE